MFSLFFPNTADRVCLNEKILSESITANPNEKYFISSLVRVIVTLPPTKVCCIGDEVIVEDIGPGGFRIAQQAGQRIQVGDELTTLGIGGKIDTILEGTTIKLSYAGDGGWIVDSVTQNVYFE